MNKLVFLLLVFVPGLGTVVAQEVDLDPNLSVNVQIFTDTTMGDGTFPTIYNAKAGEVYFFDGTIEVDFDITFKGPDNGWIMEDASPPVFYQTPAEDGTARDMVNLNEGGSVTLKNILLTGLHPNDVNISAFVRNFAGYRMIFDNCVFTDYKDHVTRTTAPTEEISITNCIFINGDRRTYSPYGGIPIRLDEACDNLLLENNTVVNSGRLLGNGGEFFTSRLHEIHCTYLNAQVNQHELHWFEGIQANNIFYNWSWIGWKEPYYENKYFTFFEIFSSVKEKLDSIALYNGRNLFYLEPAIIDYFNNELGGEVLQRTLWNHDVDTTIKADDNFTIGKNYGDFDPGFNMDPGNTNKMLEWLYAYWNPDQRPIDAPDWRIPSPVTYDADSLPVLNWPPAFDLSYSNSFLKKAGTDGLPLGDLNWFPDAKATYLAKRAVYIAALRDSMANAKDVYTPGDSASALITPDKVSVEDYISGPSEFYLYQNYPNPFNPITTIRYSIFFTSFVNIKIIDVLGRDVITLVNEEKIPGDYNIIFNASEFSSGFYFYRMQAGNFEVTKKLLLVK